MSLPAFIKILLSVIGIVVLIYLVTSIISLAIDRNENQKYIGLLDDLNNKIDSIGEQRPFIEHNLLNVEDWYLASFEKYPEIYECNSFCLCFCDKKDCSDEKICRPTDRFVLLKNKRGLESRIIGFEDISVGLDLNYDKQEGYPYTPLSLLERRPFALPLYYKFEDVWQWSPDLNNWMNTTQLKIIGGNLNGQIVHPENQDFINLLNRQTNNGKNKQAGVALLETFTRLSKGSAVLKIK